MSYGFELGELIQQYIWLFWLIHTYNNTWFGQLSPCAPLLMHWRATSLICGALVLLSALGMYFSCFSSPRSIYCHLKHPTHLNILTHACLGLINDPTHLTNINMWLFGPSSVSISPLRWDWGHFSPWHMHNYDWLPEPLEFVQCIINYVW